MSNENSSLDILDICPKCSEPNILVRGKVYDFHRDKLVSKLWCERCIHLERMKYPEE